MGFTIHTQSIKYQMTYCGKSHNKLQPGTSIGQDLHAAQLRNPGSKKFIQIVDL